MRRLVVFILLTVLPGCGATESAPEPSLPEAATSEKPGQALDMATASPESTDVEPEPRPAPREAPPVANVPAQPAVTPAASASPTASPSPSPQSVASGPPGKVPPLASVRTTMGKKHVGELLERTAEAVTLYDIVLRDTVKVPSSEVEAFTSGITETLASSHVPFATYAAWKLTKLLRIGTIQGQIALASDQGIFINLGSEHGLVAGQSVTLTGKAEVIKDPKSGEELVVYRPPLAQLKILAVVNERLSKLSITASDKPVKIERGMTVACERGSTTIVVIPPQWKSEDPNLKTGDEALYLTEHILAELVRFGVPVISRDQVQQAQAELSQKTGKPVATLPAATVGQTLKAGVLVTGQILAKGQAGNVTLHVTDLATRQYVGILAGRIRRDRIREESRKAKKAADDIKKKIGSLPAEMLRRKKIATQLIEAGVRVVLKLPNGTSVAYQDKQLPAAEVGFPPVFAFQEVSFRNGNAHLSDLLTGLRLHTAKFEVTDSSAGYFDVFEQGVRVDELQFFGAVEEAHIKRIPRGTTVLWLQNRNRISARWLVNKCPSSLVALTPGGGVSARDIPVLHARLKFRALGLCPQQLTEGWTKFLPSQVPAIMFNGYNFKTDAEFDILRRGFDELLSSDYYSKVLTAFSLTWYGQDEAVMGQLLQRLLLSPMRRARALQQLNLSGVKLRPDFVRRLQAAYPSVKIIGQ